MEKQIIIEKIYEKIELLSKFTNCSKIKLAAEEILALLNQLSEEHSVDLTTEITALTHSLNKEIKLACEAEIEWFNDSSSVEKKQELENLIIKSILHIKMAAPKREE